MSVVHESLQIAGTEVLEGAAPRRSVRRTGYRGDFVTLQTRSVAGTKAQHTRTLRSMGLRGIGNSVFGSASDPVWLGQVKKVQHLIHVIPLNAPSADLLLAKKLQHVLRSVDVRMSSRDYKIEDRRGRVVTFDNGEYIRCEQGKTRVGLVWTSALPLNTTLEALSRLLVGKATFTDAIAVTGADDDIFQGPSAEMLARVRKCPDDVSFFRLDSSNLAFSWRSDVAVSERGKIRVHECAIITELIDDQLNSALVRELATEAVGSRESLLFADFRELTDPYPHSVIATEDCERDDA